VASFSCYEMNTARLQVRTLFTELDCVDTADAVFLREGSVAASRVQGTRLYSPKASAIQSLALR
jgi:hypothetical protein